jgi:HK97 family phage major capsid protein
MLAGDSRPFCDHSENLWEITFMFVQLTREFLGKPPGERIDVSETDAKHLIEQGAAVALETDPIGPAVGRAFEQAMGRFTESLTRAVDGAIKQSVEAQGRSRRNAMPLIFGENGKGDVKRNFGDWLLCVRKGDQKTLADRYGSRLVGWDDAESKAALNTQTGTQGGYTVPEEFQAQLMQVASETAVVRPRATVVPMAGRSVYIPTLDQTTAPAAGDTAFFGGLKASWSEEAATLTETEPGFKQIELIAHELSGYSKISNTLLADNAIGLEKLLLNLFGRAIGWYEDYAFLRGSGVGKPLGVLNANALISVTRSGASAFALADAATMLSRLLPGWDPMHAVWAIHPTVMAKLFQMASTAGYVVYIDNAREKPAMVLFGIPVVVTEKLPALNVLGDVLLMNLRHYVIGDRQQIEVAFSEHVAFLNNQGTWRFVSRVDGQPWMRSAITLSDATSTLSPFVGLAPG